MKCPNCGLMDSNCKVTDSRPYRHTIKRNRRCSHCDHRWRTYEVTEDIFFYERNAKKRQLWTDLEIKNAIKFFENGMSKTEIARKLGRGRTSVSNKFSTLLKTGEYFMFLEELKENDERRRL